VKHQQQFTSKEDLINALNRQHGELFEDETREQYLLFTSVPLPQASALSHEQSRVSKFCRLSFDVATGTLVAKVMPSCVYEIPYGTMTVTFGNWRKEADSCFSPTLQAPNPPLTFVVETGLTESAGHLRLDARG
ncbi:hypothetical protein N7532_004818, partial [Penicillium argentinense]